MHRFCKRNGLTIVENYIDRAISAKTDDRPAFQKMVADSSKKTFDTIIVYTLDRFARNRYDSAVYKAKLKRNGVRVLSAKENITSDPSGIILESVLEGMAEYYSVELAQKVKRGMTENALACRWASGRIPFGYTIDADKHLHPDPALVPIVQEAFEMYAAGSKIADIARKINSYHVITGMGNKFGLLQLRPDDKIRNFTSVYLSGTISEKKMLYRQLSSQNCFINARLDIMPATGKMWLAPPLFIFCRENYAAVVVVEVCVA